MNLKFKTTLLFCAFFALGKVSSQNKYSMAFEGSLHDSYCPQNTTKEGNNQIKNKENKKLIAVERSEIRRRRTNC